MRGHDTQQAGLVSDLSPEARVPATHRLRSIRHSVDTALVTLSPQLGRSMPGLVGPRLPQKISCARCCCRYSTVFGANGC